MMLLHSDHIRSTIIPTLHPQVVMSQRITSTIEDHTHPTYPNSKIRHHRKVYVVMN
jgi:hypothetical protein